MTCLDDQERVNRAFNGTSYSDSYLDSIMSRWMMLQPATEVGYICTVYEAADVV